MLIRDVDRVVVGALAQDGHTRRELGGPDVGHEAGLEAHPKSVLERDQIAPAADLR